MAKINLSNNLSNGEFLHSFLPPKPNFKWIDGAEIPTNTIDIPIEEKNLNKYLLIQRAESTIIWLNDENQSTFFKSNNQIFGIKETTFRQAQKRYSNIHPGFNLVLHVIVNRVNIGTDALGPYKESAIFYFEKGRPKTTNAAIIELNIAIKNFEKRNNKSKISTLKKRISETLAEINMDIFDKDPRPPQHPNNGNGGGHAGGPGGGIASGVKVPAGS